MPSRTQECIFHITKAKPTSGNINSFRENYLKLPNLIINKKYLLIILIQKINKTLIDHEMVDIRFASFTFTNIFTTRL